MRLPSVSLFLLILAGFALRLFYLTTTHPFFDEYTTVLAARAILRHGWPVLPSGLFYEHGLLVTYLIAPFTALFIDTSPDEWQPAQWGLMLARWPSLLASTLTIPLIFTIGRRTLNRPAAGPALLAAGLFAFSPEGMVWGGRARMYALATLLVLLVVSWAYRGAVYPAPARYRWLALLALLAALLTQLGTITLVPPLLLALGFAGWVSARQGTVWFLRRGIILEGLGLAAVLVLALWVKRLGQPLGAVSLGEPGADSLPLELLRTVTYQATVYFNPADTLQFLARQFGVPHHFWLALAALIGGLAGLLLWLAARRQNPPPGLKFVPSFNLFLWLVFGLILLEMVTLLEPFRRNPRYLVMYLPLFYLIVGQAVYHLLHFCQVVVPTLAFRSRVKRPMARFSRSPLLALALLGLLALPALPDLRLALVTPEPAYEKAFQYVRDNWQLGDALLTMNTPAAGLYLGRADGFTVQAEADQFLLDAAGGQVDRWLGVPWLGSAAELNAVLNRYERVWFVIDTVRLPVYFRADWQAVLNSQMEQVWLEDEALLFRTRTGRVPLPSEPAVRLDSRLAGPAGDNIRLLGYALQPPGPAASKVKLAPAGQEPGVLALTLFWQPLSAVTTDYTVFLHLRDTGGATVAQYDGQPLAGAYPTSRWQPGETVLDPITLTLPADLPAGTYSLWAGLYQLATLARLPVVNDTSGENAIRLGEVTLP